MKIKAKDRLDKNIKNLALGSAFEILRNLCLFLIIADDKHQKVSEEELSALETTLSLLKRVEFI